MIEVNYYNRHEIILTGVPNSPAHGGNPVLTLSQAFNLYTELERALKEAGYPSEHWEGKA